MREPSRDARHTSTAQVGFGLEQQAAVVHTSGQA